MNMIVDQPMPFWHERDQAWIMRETEDWIVSVIPMFVNDRITICTKEEWGTSYTAGFCYDKGPTATLSTAMIFAMAWDIESEQYPPMTKKIAYDGRDKYSRPLDPFQYVCLWCRPDIEEAGLEFREWSVDDQMHLCSQCGSGRDNCARLQFSPDARLKLRYPRWED